MIISDASRNFFQTIKKKNVFSTYEYGLKCTSMLQKIFVPRETEKTWTSKLNPEAIFIIILCTYLPEDAVRANIPFFLSPSIFLQDFSFNWMALQKLRS